MNEVSERRGESKDGQERKRKHDRCVRQRGKKSGEESACQDVLSQIPMSVHEYVLVRVCVCECCP